MEPRIRAHVIPPSREPMPESEARLARSVLRDNLKVKKGESVVIEAWTHALPYARAFVEATRDLGAFPTVVYEDEAAWWRAVEKKQIPPLGSLSPTDRSAIKSADVFIYFWGPEDRPRVAGLPDAVQNRLTGWNEEWYRLARDSGLRGCRMSVAQATDAEAAAFGLDGPKWRRRLVEAGSADAGRMLTNGTRLRRALERGHEARLRHPNGTDLTFHLEGIHTRIDTGFVDAAARKRPYGMLTNSPSGQLLAAVDHGGATGRLVSNRTVYLGPNRFGDVEWRFEDGHLTDHSIGVGKETFEKEYASAPVKGRDVLGYFSVGLNPAARDLPPCEDTEAGAVLIGIGRNAMVGGKNNVPFLGYALVGEGTLEVDGRPVVRGGRIL